jgi:phospholipid/cholesterol/gamma-HCH transport system substrate-binding protein
MYDMKAQIMISKLKVGWIGTVVLVIIFLAIFFSSSIQNLISPAAQLKLELPNAAGLRPGSSVRLLGENVGSVKSLSIISDTKVIATLAIDSSVIKFIHSDAKATLVYSGLMGDMAVDLMPGSPEAGPIKPGSTITGASQIGISDLLQNSTVFLDKLTSLITQIETLVTTVGKGQGSLAQLIQSPVFYDDLTAATQSLSLILKELRAARGTLGLMIKKPALYQKMLAAASLAEEFGQKLKISSGTLNQLIKNPQLYQNLNATVNRLSRMMDSIEKGHGAASTLMSDRKFADDLKDSVREFKLLIRDIKANPERYLTLKVF